jgi:DnaJ-class molecular chaperone
LAQDPYQELGVARTASLPEIRRAFHKLAKQLHPDKNPGNKVAEERFKRVSAAFDFLSDTEKRKKFDGGLIDADGRETMRGFGGGGGGDPFGRGGGFGGGGAGAAFDGVDLNDIFGEVFGRGGGARSGFNPPPPTRGQDLRVRADIELEEAILGAKRRIAFPDGRTIEITIPKGAVDGQTLRLRGQGEGGRGGPGDALVEIAIRPHALYRREGDSLVMDLPISVPDAVLGAKIQAPTPEGPVTLTVPKGSNSGSTLRLKGRGLPDAKTGVRGDLLARLQLQLPETPDPELEAFAEAWRKDRPYSPRRKG